MKPTQALSGAYRKLRLTTKDINKGFYKGNRTGTIGRHTKYGGFKIDWERVRTFVAPSLQGFKLSPFITQNMKPTYGDFPKGKTPQDPAIYLERWKAENGLD